MGHGRESTSFYELLVASDQRMSGGFNSMVADQTGTTKWQREPLLKAAVTILETPFVGLS